MISIISKVSRTATWADVAEFDDLSSGDVIAITLKSGERVELEVAHDESGKRFFVFRDCLKDAHAMNPTNANAGGWRDSDMRRYAQQVFELLPDDLRAAIVPTKIVQVLNGERIECEDRLFCLSHTQVFGNGGNERLKAMEPEDSQLDIYKRRRNRVKEYGDGSRNRLYCYWWLRSPNTGYATAFGSVTSEGYGSNSYAGNSLGVCFGFCI